MSPLEIQIAIAHYCSPAPEQWFLPRQLESTAYKGAVQRLKDNDMIDKKTGDALPRLEAYVDALCGLPFPVQKWIMPTKEDE